jgi:23S rRNA pseudouridine2605 synthase
MKTELKSKAKSIPKFGAKSPAAKRTPKSAAKSAKTMDKSKAAGASKVAAVSKVVVASKAPSTKAKTAEAKAKTPVARTKATKAKPAEKIEAIKTDEIRAKKIEAKPTEKPAAKSKKPAAESKIPATRTRKRLAKVEEATEVRIGEPVLDPIGDVISGEARRYLGDAKISGKAEMNAYRAEAETEAADGTLDAGPGMAAASGDDARVIERPAKLERLQKILSQAGIASRRHAEEMIVAGRVMVNGQVVTQLGSKADAGRDHIRVDGKLLKGAERHRYFVLNKPKGYVTTVSDPEGRPTVMEFFAKSNERLYPVGRLDYQSEGLLLMTNDGELANLVTKAGSGVEKTYLVKVAGQPSEEELDRLRRGVAIERGEAGSERVRTSPARIRQVRVGDNPWYEVVLTEGRNRELRKMFAAIGHFAEKIRRVGYGPLELDMEPGRLRELTADEVNALRLTAEGKMKPRPMRVTLPKEARRAPGTRGERPAWRDKPAGKRFDGAQRGARGAAPARSGKPFGQREERGPRTEWKPRERTFGGESASGAGRNEDRPRFDKRAGGPPRAGSGFGVRPSRPFAARPAFGGGREGSAGRREGGAGRSNERGGERKEWKPREGAAGGRSESKPFRRDEKTGFGERGSRPPRTSSGFDKRGGKPFGARPAFGGRREGGAGRSGERGAERKEWKPREGAAGGFENAPRKPFGAQGDRPAFVRPEGSFKRSDGPKKRFEGSRGAGEGKSFGRRTGSKERWVPRPGRAGNEEGRGQASSGERPAPPSGEKRWEVKSAEAGTGRARPAYGARPGGSKRPDKPGGFSRPGGLSRPGRPSGGGSRGGPRPGGRPQGGYKRG